MPYTISKRKREGKDKFCLIRKNGSIKSCHATEEMANKVKGMLGGLEKGTFKFTKK